MQGLATSFCILVTILMVSCGSIAKVVYQTKATRSTIKYFITEKPNYKRSEAKFYARVDSGNIRIKYSFQPDNIYKTFSNQSNYVYTLVAQNPAIRLTNVDSLVFLKADRLMDSMVYEGLKRTKGAAGFVIEIARH